MNEWIRTFATNVENQKKNKNAEHFLKSLHFFLIQFDAAFLLMFLGYDM